MKVGDKIPVVVKIIRPVEDGELTKDINGDVVALRNLRGDKFWASPGANPHGPLLLVCDDGDTEAGLIRRRAIVDLLESGVGA